MPSGVVKSSTRKAVGPTTGSTAALKGAIAATLSTNTRRELFWAFIFPSRAKHNLPGAEPAKPAAPPLDFLK
jgi:hypothetical protein